MRSCNVFYPAGKIIDQQKRKRFFYKSSQLPFNNSTQISVFTSCWEYWLLASDFLEAKSLEGLWEQPSLPAMSYQSKSALMSVNLLFNQPSIYLQGGIMSFLRWLRYKLLMQWFVFLPCYFPAVGVCAAHDTVFSSFFPVIAHLTVHCMGVGSV